MGVACHGESLLAVAAELKQLVESRLCQLVAVGALKLTGKMNENAEGKLRHLLGRRFQLPLSQLAPGIVHGE